MRAPPYSSRPDEIFAPETIEEPAPLFARLRREHPVSRIAETGVHLVATWDRIDEVLHREADFSANLTGVLIRGDDGAPTTLELPENGVSRVIATADEPDHATHRALVQPRLAAGLVSELEEPIRAWAGEAISGWLEGGGGDFVPVSELIPARALARVLGLPDGDVSRHRQWAMMGGDMLAGAVGHQQIAEFAGETLRMAKYLEEHLEQARSRLRPDAGAPLMHALARGVDAGAIDVEQAVGIGIVMFGAGGESTAALIGSSVRHLAEDPAVADELRSRPEQISRFVEEVARLESPFKFHYRVVRRESELGGVGLVPGDRLMLLWASANRDTAHFEDPDVLKLDRRHPKDHLSFGRGGHFCVGAPLARLEARVVCEALLARTSDFSLAAQDPPVHAQSIFVRRLERLSLVARAAT